LKFNPFSKCLAVREITVRVEDDWREFDLTSRRHSQQQQQQRLELELVNLLE